MSNFHIGQRVAAICDFNHGFKEGDVATIAEIHVGYYMAHDGVGEFVCLEFVEVATQPDAGGYDARYFRPVVERKTDISVFTALLETTKHPVPA